ncbi:MAG: isoleucine--tRNA ligase [Ruminococcaceae bacterium]|nr:isoleucine--tRNA ligase [Oscillospiraceae bacterium]
MSVYKKVQGDLNFLAREKEVTEFWKQNDIFAKSISSRRGGDSFTFYDGPPTANGKPHIGHILTRVMKDVIPRYKTMKGYVVDRKAGWDTQGLPVEIEVEKLLKLDGKQDIERYGIEPFCEKCKESVWKYTDEWRRMSDAVGYWCDMDNPYVTYHNSYIESEWWAIKQIADKGLIYKGHKIVPYCPRCGTSLSSHEVAQGYKDVKETSIFVRFHVKGFENRYLVAWTTTPWTLPSNVALAVNKAEEYSEVKVGEDTMIMASALVQSVVGEEYEVVATYRGEELLGMEYEPLYNFVSPKEKAWYVIAGDFVTLTDGSGIVHIAPAFGEDDARVGRQNGLPFVQLVDARGCFTPEVTPWAGTFCKDGDKAIISELASRGLLLKALKFEHSYPFCWRCDTPLLYYAMESWFIETTKIRDRLIANNRTINWYPDNIKEGRMGNFLENNIDWCLTRSRYWGTPLPVWVCSCGHIHTVGSIAELRELGRYEDGSEVPEDIELHKAYVDKVVLTCPECGGQMRRTPEVIDCWFDSGSMPFAQYHYPFENKELFESHFPADFISEAIDQTRGWFYTLLTISTLLFDKAPFRNCIVLGHVCDKDGLKMSKHKGNVVDPWSILDKQGADAVRWYFCSGSAPWLPSRFYEDAVNESQRKFMGTLWNTYSFFVLYANIDGFDPKKHACDPAAYTVMDKWLLSKLSALTAEVDADLDAYRITEASRAISEFTDELSNWYVRLNRERYWGTELTEDKKCAYNVLYNVLVTLAKLSAPFVPFISEEIYQNLVRSVDESAPESVHLCDFPVPVEADIDKALEKSMGFVRRVVELGRACRAASGIKNSQPLNAVYIRTTGDDSAEGFEDLIEGELNVKNVVSTDNTASFVSYSFKPQLKTVGRKYGKLVPAIKATLEASDGSALMAELTEKGSIALTVNGEAINMTEDELLIETRKAEGFVSENDRELTVAIDTTITAELEEEGLVRELKRKLQTMRKAAGFDVTDRIRVSYKASGKVKALFEKFAEDIASAILADAIEEREPSGYVDSKSIQGEDAVIGVEKI